MKKAPLSYDQSSFFTRWLMIYAIPLISYFKSVEPKLEELPDFPTSFQFEEKFKKLKEDWNRETQKENPSFLRVLIRTSLADYAKGSFLMNSAYSCNLVFAVLIQLVVDYLNDEDASWTEGLTLGVIIVSLSFFRTVAAMRGCFLILITIGRMKNWICMIVGEKITKISYKSLYQGNSTGKVINSVSSDIELFELLIMTSLIWVIPLYIPVSIGLLWMYIGEAAFIGMGIILVHLFVTIKLGKISMNVKMKLSKYTDARIKHLENLIEGIRVVKLSGWEKPFLKTIFNERNKEIKQFKVLAFYSVILKTIFFGLNGLSIFIPIFYYIQMGNEISVGSAFGAATILLLNNQLINYFAALGFRSLFLFVASCKRISSVLLMPEVNSYSKKQTSATVIENTRMIKSMNSDICLESQIDLSPCKLVENPIIQVNDAILSWNSDVFQLKNLNFSVEGSEMLIISGSIGSGKSTLLMGLLRELPFDEGEFLVRGSMSYLSDTPWIISASVRENILMGQEFQADLYNLCLEASAFKEDLNLMHAGDETLVGDRGITLSGGQKVRLCLARALYADRQIILLDDPLSAVDSKVSSHIFNSLRGLNKLVVLVTHQLQYLPYTDKVLILEDGAQTFFGTYSEFESNATPIIEHREKKEPEENSKINTGGKQSLEAEESASGAVPFKLYWFYLKLGFKKIWWIGLVLLILIVSQFWHLSVYLFLGLWTADSDNQEDSFYTWGIIFIVLMLYLSSFVRFILLYSGLISSNKAMHNNSLKRVTQTKSVFFDKNPSGRILNRFTKDVSIIDENLLYFFIESLTTGLIIFGNIILIVIISPFNIIGFGCFMLMFFIIAKLIAPICKSLRRIELLTRSPLLTSISSMIGGLVSIRAMNLESIFIADVNRAAYDNLKAYGTFHIVLRYIQFMLELGCFFVVSCNGIVILLLKGSISPELGAVTMSLSVGLMGNTSLWSKNLLETDNYMASTQRLVEYSSIPNEGSYKTNPDFKISRGKIQFSNVSLKYRKNLPFVLRDLSFKIKGGQKVGVIGRTGAGKSSIMQVLYRLTDPFEGTVFIDGQDYKTCGLHDLRLQMSVIPQTPFLFRSSIRENLDPFAVYTDDEIFNVLKNTRLLDLVEKLDDGIYTQIASDKINMSTGQKQMICMARAIIRQNKVVLMDEATANVDNTTDKLIQKTIKKLFVDSTVLIIAHRLRTIVNCDKLIVMDQGRCVETGRPEKLGKKKTSMFRNFIEFSEAEEKEYLLSRIYKE